jgi:NAD(P)-dependent dehydrogenase (short-subunit alcohol dehydrogenase family)
MTTSETSAPVAVVTGASRGIGRQLCIDLADAGYDVVCAARSTQGRPSNLPGTVDETADEVRAHGRRALAVGLDVRDESAMATFAQMVFDEWGRCDLLVNNAAVAPPRPALEDSVKRWRLAVDVNLNGPFYAIYYFSGRMSDAAAGGRVVNVSSAVAAWPQFGRASYTTTKRALEAMTESLAHDLRDRVAVNALRIDLPIYSDGFGTTLSDDTAVAFEHPAVATDAVLWLARQPLDHTGRIHTLTELRSTGVVRPTTLYTRATAAAD